MNVKERFLEVYDKYSAALLRHVFFRVSSEAVAQDIIGETFFRAWRAIAGGEEVKNLKAFFYKIANNLVIDYYRSKKEKIVSLEEIIEASGEVPSEEDSFKALSDKEYIGLCLKELDQETRQIITLRFLDDLKVSSIAEICNKSPNYISVIIHRGLKKLREKMKNV